MAADTRDGQHNSPFQNLVPIHSEIVGPDELSKGVGKVAAEYRLSFMKIWLLARLAHKRPSFKINYPLTVGKGELQEGAQVTTSKRRGRLYHALLAKLSPWLEAN